MPGRTGQKPRAAEIPPAAFDISKTIKIECYEGPGVAEVLATNGGGAGDQDILKSAWTLDWTNSGATDAVVTGIKVVAKTTGAGISGLQIQESITGAANNSTFQVVAAAYAEYEHSFQVPVTVPAGSTITFTAVGSNDIRLAESSFTFLAAFSPASAVAEILGAAEPAMFNVVTRPDGVQTAYNQETNAEVDITAGIPADWAECDTTTICPEFTLGQDIAPLDLSQAVFTPGSNGGTVSSPGNGQVDGNGDGDTGTLRWEFDAPVTVEITPASVANPFSSAVSMWHVITTAGFQSTNAVRTDGVAAYTPGAVTAPLDVVGGNVTATSIAGVNHLADWGVVELADITFIEIDFVSHDSFTFTVTETSQEPITIPAGPACEQIQLLGEALIENQPVGTDTYACALGSTTLAPGDFTYTGAAAASGSNITLGGGGGDGGIAELELELEHGNSGTRHILQYSHAKNAAGGETLQLRVEVTQFGVVIASEEFAATEPPAVVQTLDFYPTANYEVRFIDLTAPGAGGSRDILIAAMTVETTCEAAELEEITCLGKCDPEPLTLAGALQDGTTYTVTAEAGITVNDNGDGNIEHGQDGTITIDFSAPVDLQILPATVPGRFIWHMDNDTGLFTSAVTDGSDWIFEPGTWLNNPFLEVNGQTVTGTSLNSAASNSPSGDSDWGSLTSKGATSVTVFAADWDRFNYQAQGLGAVCEKPICEVIDELREDIADIVVDPSVSETLCDVVITPGVPEDMDRDLFVLTPGASLSQPPSSDARIEFGSVNGTGGTASLVIDVTAPGEIHNFTSSWNSTPNPPSSPYNVLISAIDEDGTVLATAAYLGGQANISLDFTPNGQTVTLLLEDLAVSATNGFAVNTTINDGFSTLTIPQGQTTKFVRVSTVSSAGIITPVADLTEDLTGPYVVVGTESDCPPNIVTVVHPYHVGTDRCYKTTVSGTEADFSLEPVLAGEALVVEGVEVATLEVVDSVSGITIYAPGPTVGGLADGGINGALAATSIAGIATHTWSFPWPVTVTFGFASLRNDEPITLLTPGSDAANQTFSNGNSANSVLVTWTDVTEVAYEMLSPAAAASNVRIVAIEATIDVDVRCYNTDGVITEVQSVHKNIVDLDLTGATECGGAVAAISVCGDPTDVFANDETRLKLLGTFVPALSGPHDFTASIVSTFGSVPFPTGTINIGTSLVVGPNSSITATNDVFSMAVPFSSFLTSITEVVNLQAGIEYFIYGDAVDDNSVITDMEFCLTGGGVAGLIPVSTDPASTELGNLTIVGDDGEEYALPLKSEDCYLEDGPSAPIPGLDANNMTGDFGDGDTFFNAEFENTTGAAIAITSLVLSLPAWTATGVTISAFFGGITGSVPVTPGPAQLVEIVFSSPIIVQPNSTQGGDVASTDEFTAGQIVDGATANATVQIRHETRTYSDGETDKIIEFDAAGDPQEITIDPLWTLCGPFDDVETTAIHAIIDATPDLVTTCITEYCDFIGFDEVDINTAVLDELPLGPGVSQSLTWTPTTDVDAAIIQFDIDTGGVFGGTFDVTLDLAANGVPVWTRVDSGLTNSSNQFDYGQFLFVAGVTYTFTLSTEHTEVTVLTLTDRPTELTADNAPVGFFPAATILAAGPNKYTRATYSDGTLGGLLDSGCQPAEDDNGDPIDITDLISCDQIPAVEPVEKICCPLGVEVITETLPTVAPANGTPGTIVAPAANIVINPAFGTPETVPVQFHGLDGNVLNGFITVSRLNNFGSTLQITPGGSFARTGNGDLRVEVGLDCPSLGLRWGMTGQSAGGGEQLVFLPESQVTEYAQGAGGTAMVLPFDGTWANGNNSASSGFGFDAADSFAYNSFSTQGISSVQVVYLRDVPNVYGTACEQIAAVHALIGDVDTPMTMPVNAGLNEVDDALANLNDNVPIHFQSIDDTAQLESAAGLDFVTVIDGVVTPATAGPITVPDGAQGYLFRNTSGDIVVTYQTVGDVAVITPETTADIITERSFEAEALVDAGQNMNSADVLVTTTSTVLETGWSHTAEALEYSGSPRKVQLRAHARQASTGTGQRMTPILRIQKANGAGGWVGVYDSRTGYTRGSTVSAHTTSTNMLVWTDLAPGLDPKYRLLTGQATSVTQAMAAQSGYLQATATELVTTTVLVPAPATTGGATSTGTLTAAPDAQIFNFQDQFAAFNLQVGNQVNVANTFEIIVRNRPYGSIDGLSLSGYTHQVVANGSLFDHVFTLTTPLAAFANINIAGLGITPAGDGNSSDVEIYLI